MGRKPYRFETTCTGNRTYHYIVKDVRLGERKTKVKVYVGNKEPSPKERERLRLEHAYTLEARAAEKKAELVSSDYTSQYLTPDDIRTIETIHFYYKTFTSLLTVNEIEVYENNFEIAYINGTTNIEGNTLTHKQAFDLLVNNITPDGKSLREINEVQNFRKVKTYRDQYHGKVTVDFIKNLHSLILDNIDFQSAGAFRRIEVTIGGCDEPVTPAILIQSELTQLIENYYEQLDKGVHPFEATIMFHYGFEMIHPFTDGNGRVGREILNFMLRRCGYPRLLFLGEDRETYIRSLKLGNQEQYTQMIQVFYELIKKQRYTKLIENLQTIVTPPKDFQQLRLTKFFPF